MTSVLKVKRISLLCLVLAVAFSGCTSVSITPQTIATAHVDPAERDHDLKAWKEAVWLCNAFLASSYRKTLPFGHVQLTDGGVEFTGDHFVQPCRIRCTLWGDVLVAFGMRAQERSDGFVVGYTQPRRDRVADNSFFKHPNGALLPNTQLAAAILHEMTHTYFHQGTVDFGTGFRYYAEAVFLFRYRHHSMERLPFQTSSEFRSFLHAYGYSRTVQPTSVNE
jgi:hypothetical protein